MKIFNGMNSLLVFILIFNMEESMAQLSKSKSRSWIILNSLPAPVTAKEHPGVAGPIVGIFQNQLIVAGGANFPNGFPWQGGIKKYWDDIYVLKKEGLHSNGHR